MKKLYATLITLAIFTSAIKSQTITHERFYKNNPSLGGECVINKSTISVEDSVISTTFEINVDEAGCYNAGFWLLPSQNADGTFNCYRVAVNGNGVVESINPSTAGWQAVSMNTKIWLDKGTNTISVIAGAPEVPEVEFVKIGKTKLASTISTEDHDSELNKIRQSIETQATVTNDIDIDTLVTVDNLQGIMTAASTSTTNDPKYDYEYKDWVPLKYTFYKRMYFSKGKTISISTVGQNNFNNVIELFSASAPETYSWVSMSSNGRGSLNQTAPVAGYYYIRVRSYKNGADGIADVTINGSTYSSVQLFSIGYSFTMGTDQYYNCFTKAEASDPIMWLEESGSPGIISAYNDDYTEDSDFEWGSSARIHKKFPRNIAAIHISAYSSYKPELGLEMYAKCKDSNAYSVFPNLKQYDAIASSPASGVYNCISWSGGITSYWEWPGSSSSAYYVVNDVLASFDKFYSSTRYSGCAKYTRTKATKDTSVLDLWAIKTSSGYEYTHASIKDGADEHQHGYEWESKPGGMTRTFHPRFSLEGDDYGQVVAYYIRSNSSTATVSMDESLADESSALETVTFNDTELSVIDEQISIIPPNERTAFQEKLEEWSEYCENSMYSNPEQLKNCASYTQLLAQCKENSNLLYLVYSELGKSNHFMVILLEDLQVKNNYSVMEEAKSEETSITRIGNQHIIQTPLGNTMKFVKKMLDKTENLEQDIHLSNTDDVKISKRTSDGNISIDISVDKTAVVSVEVVDDNGSTVKSRYTSGKLGKGKHSIPVSIEGVI